MSATLEAKRQAVRELLNEFDAADALASYYALHHDAGRSALFTRANGEGQTTAFLARCQTGFDLFRPVVTLRARGGELPESLLREGLLPGRPYLLIVQDTMVKKLKPYVSLTDLTLNLVLRLDLTRFEPAINVLVQESLDPQGSPRCEIRQGEQVMAVAGVNWRSPIFAEVYVHVGQRSRGRGWGKAVVSACVESLLRMDVTPLYMVAEQNQPSVELARRVGFVDTGAREVVGQGVLLELPGQEM